MKLLSFMHEGRETWGAVVGDGVVDLGKRMPQYPTLADYIGSGAYLQAAKDVQGQSADARLDAITFLPVIPRPEKIICAVRNYMDHHQEVLAAGMHRELSEEPPIFLRVWRSQTAHNQPIVRPRVSESLDWEGELAVIIGEGGATLPKPMPSSMSRATPSTTMAACASGSSMPSKSRRAKTLSPPAALAPGWSQPMKSRPTVSSNLKPD